MPWHQAINDPYVGMTDTWIIVCNIYITLNTAINILRLRQNGCRFADNVFKCIFFNETEFLSQFHWSLFLRVHASIGSDNGLAQIRQQAIIWTNDGLVYWCIFASLGLSELRKQGPHREDERESNHWFHCLGGFIFSRFYLWWLPDSPVLSVSDHLLLW